MKRSENVLLFSHTHTLTPSVSPVVGARCGSASPGSQTQRGGAAGETGLRKRGDLSPAAEAERRQIIGFSALHSRDLGGAETDAAEGLGVLEACHAAKRGKDWSTASQVGFDEVTALSAS